MRNKKLRLGKVSRYHGQHGGEWEVELRSAGLQTNVHKPLPHRAFAWKSCRGTAHLRVEKTGVPALWNILHSFYTAIHRQVLLKLCRAEPCIYY